MQHFCFFFVANSLKYTNHVAVGVMVWSAFWMHRDTKMRSWRSLMLLPFIHDHQVMSQDDGELPPYEILHTFLGAKNMLLLAHIHVLGSSGLVLSQSLISAREKMGAKTKSVAFIFLFREISEFHLKHLREFRQRDFYSSNHLTMT